MASEYDYYKRLMLVGDCKVGKSSILSRFADDKYTFKDNDYVATIGVEFKVKTIELNSKKVKMQIWDSTGNEKQRFLHTVPHYKGAQGMIMVYDVNDRDSFEHLKDFSQLVQEYAKAVEAKFIVGNKVDDSSNRAVTVDEAKEFAAAQGCHYFEVSAKTGENISEVFTDMATKLIPELAPSK